MGEPVPDDFEGHVLTTIFDKEIETRTTPSLEEPHPKDGVHRGAPPEEQDTWAAQQAVAQLADLGYVECSEAGVAKQVASAIEAHDSHLAQIYYATSQFTEALELLRNLEKQCPNDPSYRARQAMCLIALRRVDQADVIVREILATNPHYALTKMLSGQIAIILGETAKAEAIFSEFKRS